MNRIRQLHGHALRQGLDLTQILVSKVLELPDVGYARRLLDSAAAVAPVFLYNKVLQGCSGNGLHLQGLSLYAAMRRRGRAPNPHSFTFLFAACAAVPAPAAGRAAHGQLLKLGLPMDAYVSTSLLDMYGKSGLLQQARQVFDEMPQRDAPSWNSIIGGHARAGELATARALFEAMPVRNVVSWTSMVSGYAQNCQYEEAVAIFTRMWAEGKARPNEVTVASVLPACANLCALELGKKVELYAMENGFTKNLFVSNALLEMHAKCGSIERARELFDEMGDRRNLCSWNSMIMGLAVHGGWNQALELFHQMRVSRSKLSYFLLAQSTNPTAVKICRRRGSSLMTSHSSRFFRPAPTEGWWTKGGASSVQWLTSHSLPSCSTTAAWLTSSAAPGSSGKPTLWSRACR